jgi:peptidyl-dipeptidase Dcp
MTDPRPANPLLETWATPFGLAPFERIETAHFRPAFDAAIAEHAAEIARIAKNGDAATFDNTIAAIERSGRALRQVSSTFFNLTGAHTNPELQAIEREIAPVLSRHRSSIFMNGDLFRRVDDLHRQRSPLGLDAEQARVLDRYRTIFVRAGARLDEAGKARLAAIGERLATLGTLFSQNVLADESGYTLELDGEDDLAGLPDFVRAAAARAADERGFAGKHVITLSRSLIEPFLQFSARRDLRERAYGAWIRRGDNGGPTDNKAVIAEMVQLRAERAKLLGFKSFAEFKLDDTMAKTPGAVTDLLDRVWAPARARAGRERDALQALASREGQNIDIGPHDWRFYAEKQRRAEHDLDEGLLKPYFPLDRMIEAAFDVAGRLFGLRFREVDDLALYHPDVRAWEVTDAGGRPVGLFLGDYFARPSKRSGAWMSAFRSQERLAGDIRPIIVNVMNFAKGAEGEPALLSFDDARTLFHEFGHALHGLLSDVTFPLIAGTSVPGDFVELPSQLYEHWLSQPQVLRRFARHHRTGEALPEELIERLTAARNFNQGFATVEYTASAIFDMDLHRLPNPSGLDPAAFERETLSRIGMPDEIAMRHRPPQFSHIFSGDGYAAGYYSYLWSEVLDADAFRAFEEAGDIFDPGVAERLKTFVYAAGGKREPAEAYTAFRGRLPSVDALLEKRGLAEPAPGGDA